jgi:hypothetical protein
VFVGLANAGYTFLFNEWYQAWLFGYIFILVLLVAIVVYYRLRRRPRATKWRGGSAKLLYGQQDE